MHDNTMFDDTVQGDTFSPPPQINPLVLQAQTPKFMGWSKEDNSLVVHHLL